MCFCADADSLCSKLTEKINTSHEHRILIAQNSLLLASLKVESSDILSFSKERLLPFLLLLFLLCSSSSTSSTPPHSLSFFSSLSLLVLILLPVIPCPYFPLCHSLSLFTFWAFLLLLSLLFYYYYCYYNHHHH